MTRNDAEPAKQVLEANAGVLYGIFGVIEGTGYFPPLPFLNEFLAKGYDPCDQDGRMADWVPFTLSPEAYAEVKSWWLKRNPGAVEDALEATSWEEWVQTLLNP